ncbi:hypothetical protein KEM52_001861 [Ascosphaera acerosa]|nr:hypothetical protein KEM52_001861 [Ascosphaera acerosa]
MSPVSGGSGLKPSRRATSKQRRASTAGAGAGTGTSSSTRERLRDIFGSSSRNPSPAGYMNPPASASNLFRKRSKTGLTASSVESAGKGQQAQAHAMQEHLGRTRTESDSAIPQNSIEFPLLRVETDEASVTASLDQGREGQGADSGLAKPKAAEETADQGSQSASSSVSRPLPQVVVSPSGNMISHRRVRSSIATTSVPNASSKPASTPKPIKETPAQAATRSRSQNASSGLGGGFFASMLSAATNAIGMSQQPISSDTQQQGTAKSASNAADAEAGTGVAGGNGTPDAAANGGSASSEPKKTMAVDTLGEGELALSDLGINAASSSGTGDVLTTGDGLTLTKAPTSGANGDVSPASRDELAARIEELRTARAVSRAYDQSPTDETADAAADAAARGKAQRGPVGRGTALTRSQRADSDGSRLSSTNSAKGARKGTRDSMKGVGVGRAPRKSSGATVSALGRAGLIGGAAARPGIQRLTGFAVASKKRNKEFHQLFRSVPEDDYLIEDYSCALQREIILAGRIYISEGHICFSSNILGWVTTLVISFDEIIAIEKETTAMVFPNAIAIQTLHARQTFRSLLSREATYDLMVSIWRINHPTSLRSFVNGTRIDNGTGDKTEKLDEQELEELNDSGLSDSEEYYDEDEDEPSFTQFGSPNGSILSGPSKQSGTGSNGQTTPIQAGDGEAPSKPGESASGFPGPTTHEPTEYPDPAARFDKVLKDEVIAAPLGQIYDLIFGPSSGVFLAKFLTDNQKVLDVQIVDDKKGLDADNKSRTYSYIKPLGASIGPKQTKCITSETLEYFDLNKAVCVLLSTQSPDVPSGNAFLVKTKYILTWAKVEWTGKSWLKGVIEKGSNDGQTAYNEDLFKAIRAHLSSQSRGAVSSSKSGKNGKRQRKREPTKDSKALAEQAAAVKEKAVANWGVFEPLHAPLSAMRDALQPVLGGNVAVAVILVLVVLVWFRSSGAGRAPSHTIRPAHMPLQERLAFYEDMWFQQEGELWDWLEERAGLSDQSFLVRHPDPESHRRSIRTRKDLRAAQKLVDQQLSEGQLSQRDMENAIRLTQDRLEVLQSAVRQRAPATTVAAADAAAVPDGAHEVPSQ